MDLENPICPYCMEARPTHKRMNLKLKIYGEKCTEEFDCPTIGCPFVWRDEVDLIKINLTEWRKNGGRR